MTSGITAFLADRRGAWVVPPPFNPAPFAVVLDAECDTTVTGAPAAIPRRALRPRDLGESLRRWREPATAPVTSANLSLPD